MSYITLFFALLLLMSSVQAQTTAYSHGDPTPEEQQMLEMVNRARANPTAEGIRLMDTKDGAVQQAYTYWQIDRTATKAAFTKYPQRPPLAFHPSLIQISRGHTADMVAKNFQGHTGSDGSSMSDRYNRGGYQSQGMYGENVAAYSNSVWYGHCGLNVDWGPQNQIDLGHRKNIMNFEGYNYTEIGIAITYTGGAIPNVGPYVITQNFGMRGQRYVVGVVYDDKNKNQEYDPGEGIPGVRIQPSSGMYHAVTSTSGGYAFPYSGTSSITVTASGGGLPSEMKQTVQLTGDNVKVDFMPGGSVPSAPTLAYPANSANNTQLPANLGWKRVNGATGYQVQVSTSQGFTTGMLLDTTLTDTVLRRVYAPCATRTYWRVRASNDNGSGPWSSAWSFTPARTTSAIAGVIGPNGPATTDGTLRFTWKAGTNDPIAYELHVIKSGSRFYTDSAITDTVVNVPGFTEAGSYEWRVRPKNACGWHSWTSLTPFTLTITSVDEDQNTLGTASAIDVRPNPADASAMIYVTTAQSAQALLFITDVTGRELGRFETMLDAGLNAIPMSSIAPVDVMPSGVVTLSMRTAAGVISRQVAIVR
ncbi:MAG: hypothetical protein FGM24_02140 [Candidatus Kapabacteria bacterium]|nr:hypothetical protein [Candidatus Kapabacteria bacterium]